jgi:hypothetical protein
LDSENEVTLVNEDKLKNSTERELIGYDLNANEKSRSISDEESEELLLVSLFNDPCWKKIFF